MNVNYVLLLIFLGCAGILATGGIWSNLIKLFNILFAALLAVNYWEPVASWLEGQAPSLTYLLDFVALWVIFGLSMALFTVATDGLSKVKVRFPRRIDLGVGIFLGCWVAWVMVCFTTMTLHTAPLAQHFLGFQPDPAARMFFSLSPDRIWLSFVHKESQGALSRIKKTRPFDPDGSFILKYGERRGKYEKQLGVTVGQ